MCGFARKGVKTNLKLTRGFAWLTLVGAAFGCSPTAPGVEVGPTFTPSSGSVSGVVSLSGVPVRTGGRILYSHYFGTSDRPSTTGLVDVSAETGSFEIKGLPFASATAAVEAFFINDSLAAGPIHQPCVTSAPVTGNTRLNVELFPLGVTPAGTSPTLSGVVFERDRDGNRTPIAGAFLNFRGSANTRTDEQGRYQFCRMPQGSTTLLVGQACNEFWMSANVVVQGDTTHDIDMTGWCPGRQ